MAVTTGDAPGGDAPAKVRGTWEWAFGEVRRIAGELIQEALKNYRPKGLGSVFFEWDSGASGTALTASATRPNGWVRVPYPAEGQRWHAEVYPSGSATIAIKAVAPDAALSTAATLLTLTATASETSDDTFAKLPLTDGTRLAAFLMAVSGSPEVVSVNFEHRKT